MSRARNIEITFDTLQDMKADPDLKPGMVVATLGKNKINDSYGAIYKIVGNEGASSSFSTEHIEFDNNDYVHAEPIGSSNYEDRIKAMQSAITTNAVKIGNNTADIDELKNNITNVQECFSADSIYDAYKLTGVRIILLGNGQKAIVVTDIPVYEDDYIDEDTNTNNTPKSSDDETTIVSTQSEEVSDSEVIATEAGVQRNTIETLNDDADDSNPIIETINPVTCSLEGTVATITVPIPTYRWIEPATLRLVGYANTTLYVNDNCKLVYDGENIIFTVNRQLNPAVYYYM